jgi:hypothetical protein
MIDVRIKAFIGFLIIFGTPICIDIGIHNFLNPIGFWQNSVFLTVSIIIYIPMVFVMYFIVAIILEVLGID